MLRRLVWCLILVSLPAPGGELPPSHDLAPLAAQARQAGVPLLLLFSQPHCEYCARLQDEVLSPLAAAAGQRVLIARVHVAPDEVLRDFAGQPVSAQALAARYQVRLFPTVLLVNARGEALVPPVVGYQTPELYPAYLEAAIEAGRRLIADETGANTRE
jgi:thioredoxin-related protein